MVIVPGVPPFSARAAHSTSHPSRRRLSEDDAGVVQVHGCGIYRLPVSAAAASDGKLQARRGRVAGGRGRPGALDERAVDGPGARGQGRVSLLGVSGQKAQCREPGVVLARVRVWKAEDGKLDLGKLLLLLGLGGFGQARGGGGGGGGRLAVLGRDRPLAVWRRLRRSLTRIRLSRNKIQEKKMQGSVCTKMIKKEYK